MKRLDSFDWTAIEAALDREGQAVLAGLLSAGECQRLVRRPSPTALREALYERLVPLANRWSAAMGSAIRYPARLDELQQMCRAHGQRTPQSALVRLRAGEYQPLRQHAQGTCVFPVQAAVLLSEPGREFSGGEMLMTEQRPRMQTRPMVLPLQRGDATVFAVHYRPFRGSKGVYRVNLRHAVSPVRSGERAALELVFHDAP